MADLGEVAGLVGFTGHAVELDLAGERVAAFFEQAEAEVRRRREVGLGAVTDRVLLQALSQLPLGHRIPALALDAISRAALELAPAGVVQRSAQTFERVWQPAVRLTGIVACRNSLATAVRAAAWFAPDCSRVALAPVASGQVSERVVAEALELEVGVMFETGDNLKLIRRPGRALVSPGPRHWRLVEQVFAAWTRSGHPVP